MRQQPYRDIAQQIGHRNRVVHYYCGSHRSSPTGLITEGALAFPSENVFFTPSVAVQAARANWRTLPSTSEGVT